MNHQVINSQLIFGVQISEEFSAIMQELHYSFNSEDSLFFQIGLDTIFGISIPHEERHNTQENVLYEYPVDFQQQILNSYKQTCEGFVEQLKKMKEKSKITEEDYYFIRDELHQLENEQPHIFLYATHEHT